MKRVKKKLITKNFKLAVILTQRLERTSNFTVAQRKKIFLLFN